ncbi:TonB-dependent receptor [Tellurirhabdus rosea]|uniref:TonB-dependent receptor n=1 Tax=Tellurirhabdus rosea TaxID=2674997 RepID=UPI00225356DB|nr:TonB-dependent receptor [Tellurirhabdus rosea]
MIRLTITLLVVLAALLIRPYELFAQTRITVSGKATYNGIRPLPGVSITLDGTYDGATTNEKGEFHFETEETGPFTLSAKVGGFVDVVQNVTLEAGKPLRLNVVFTTKAFSLNDVVVRPRLFDLNDKNKFTTLSPQDILTTATDGNVNSALKALPGAQAVGESGDLFVRGGTGTETKVFIDGLQVANFNQSGPTNLSTRSRFVPGMFKGTFFTTGGYSAQYGQALSAAVMLETEDVPTKSSAEFMISPVLASGTVQQLSRDRNTVFGGGLQHTNLNLYRAIDPGVVRFTRNPQFWDGNVFLRRKTQSGGVLKAFVNGGYSRMGLDRDNLDYAGVTNRIGLTNQNLYSNLTYRQPLKNGWKLQAGASYGYNRDQTRVGLRFENGVRPDSSLATTDESTLGQGRAVFSKLVLHRTRLFIGGEYQYVTERRNNTGFTDHYAAPFVETESYLTDRLSVRAGLRAEYSSLLDRANVAPRLSVGYTTDERGLLSLSYGRFFQKPDRQFLLQNQNLSYTAANHYIVSYQRLTGDRTFRTEVFYKNYSGLVRTLDRTDNGGHGYARGFEVFWRDRKSLRGVDYWVSYSLLDTKRQFLDYPTLARPHFAARHTGSLVVKRFFPGLKINAGLTYTYASGRPFANPNRPVAEFMTDRTMDYHNLGLNLAYLPKIKNTYSVVVLTVSNVLGNRQVFGYQYSATNPARREAIVPTSNPFIFLGFITSLGIDRRQEIINAQ